MEFDMRIFRTNTHTRVKTKEEFITPMQGLFTFGVISTIGIGIGSAIGTYVFFGTATLTGLIVVIESQPILKKLASKSNKAIDLAILGASIYAIGALGVTVAASLTFAGLGYTLVYAPYLRAVRE